MSRWWKLPEGWLCLPLLAGMLVTVVVSVQQAEWVTSLRHALGILTPAVLLGLAVGFLLAWVRWIPRAVAHVVGVVGGMAWVIYLSGTLRAVWVPDASQAVSYLSPALQGWKDLATELLIRIIILWRTFLRGASGEDIVIFIVILAFVAWMLGFLAAWFTFRSHWSWVAVGLPGFVILLNQFYAPKAPPAYFGIYAFLGLFFLIYYLWRQRERNWQQQKVRYSREMSQGILMAGIVVSAILVLGTSLLPTTAGGAEAGSFWDSFLQPWREVRQTWERLFSNVGGSPREGRYREYDAAFTLGGARTDPEGIAFEVRAAYNDYLRGISFDQYNGHGWTNTATHGLIEQLTGRITLPNRARIRVSQEVIPRLQGGNMVFAFAEPISATLPAVAELSKPLSQAGFADIVAVRSRVPLDEGQPYGVISLFSLADKTSLRRAGQTYPDWMRDLYLQLPGTIPQRVRDLADQIVATALKPTSSQGGPGEMTLQTAEGDTIQVHIEAGRVVSVDPAAALAPGELALPAPAGGVVRARVEEGRIVSVFPSGGLVRSGLVNPYDAAEAIESWLRTQMTYDQNIAAPPSGRDVVDYFLFDSKVGYCDYFATAMVVLLRTQDIPARLIRGYAAGSYDADARAYIIPLALAHSWVEVYFPEFGWQRFEPTAAGYTSMPLRPELPPNQGSTTPGVAQTPATTRTPREDNMGEDEDFQPGAGRLPTSSLWAQAIRVVLYVLGSLVLVAIAAMAVLGMRVGVGLRRLSPVAATYERMCRWAGLVRLRAPGQPTPRETADHIAGALPEQRPRLDQIVTLYVRERFGRHRPFGQEVTGVRQAWRGLRWPLWKHPLQGLRRKKTEKPAEEEAE